VDGNKKKRAEIVGQSGAGGSAGPPEDVAKAVERRFGDNYTAFVWG